MSKNRGRPYKPSEREEYENSRSGSSNNGNRGQGHIFHNLVILNGNGTEEEMSEPNWVSSVSDYEKNRTITTGNSTLRLRGPKDKEKDKEKEKEKEGSNNNKSNPSNRSLNASNMKNIKGGTMTKEQYARHTVSATASASAIVAAGGTANMDALFWALEQQELEKQKQQEKEEMNKQIRKVKISKNLLLLGEHDIEIENKNQQMKRKNKPKKTAATVTTSDVESTDPVSMDLELPDSRSSPILASPLIKCL